MAVTLAKRKMLADGTIVETFESGADLIDITSSTVPRPSWRWMCPRGHVVQWERDEKYTGPSCYHLVNVRERHREVSEYDEYTPATFYVCATCPRGRKPVNFSDAYQSNNTREFMHGMVWYRLNGVEVTKERADEVIATLLKGFNP